MEQLFDNELIYYEITKRFSFEKILYLCHVCSSWENSIKKHLSHERFLSIGSKWREDVKYPIIGPVMNLNSKKFHKNYLFCYLFRSRSLETELEYLPNIEECFISLNKRDFHDRWPQVSKLLSKHYPNLKKLILPPYFTIQNKIIWKDLNSSLNNFKSLEAVMIYSLDNVKFDCRLIDVNIRNRVTHSYIYLNSQYTGDINCNYMIEIEQYHNLKSLGFYSYLLKSNFISYRLFQEKSSDFCSKHDINFRDCLDSDYDIIYNNYLEEFYDYCSSDKSISVVSTFFYIKNISQC